MKITGAVEQIFSQAVALDQNGGLRNSIYAEGREIFIINYDHTVLMRFRLRGSELAFDNPISFKANDYDSNDFEETNGKIVFLTQADGYQRKKVCGKAEHSPAEMKKLIQKYLKDESPREEVIISKKILNLLDSELSHIEFSGKKGGVLTLVQRNIYSGGVVEVSEVNDGMFTSTLSEDFGALGIKTGDFISLFAFQDHLKFYFPKGENEDFVIVKSMDKNKRDMTVILAMCIYDELIEIKETRKEK